METKTKYHSHGLFNGDPKFMPLFPPFSFGSSSVDQKNKLKDFEDEYYLQTKRFKMTTEERISKLEERVFQSHTDSIMDLKSEMKAVNNKLTWLIVILAGNFGLGFLTKIPLIGN